MSVDARDLAALSAAARIVASAVVDPEIPTVSIADLGILRDVVVVDDHVEVVITPTYSGCPAMHAITVDLERALAEAGLAPVRVRTVLSPAWTTDWITPAGREQLRLAGIAPPAPVGGRPGLFFVAAVPCPRCGSTATTRIAAFGSTACKALWRCDSCREPFDAFKCH